MLSQQDSQGFPGLPGLPGKPLLQEVCGWAALCGTPALGLLLASLGGFLNTILSLSSDAGPMGSRGQRLCLVIQPVNALSVLVRWPQGQTLMTDEAEYGA